MNLKLGWNRRSFLAAVGTIWGGLFAPAELNTAGIFGKKRKSFVPPVDGSPIVPITTGLGSTGDIYADLGITPLVNINGTLTDPPMTVTPVLSSATACESCSVTTEVPHRADGTRHFAVRLHGAFRFAIASGAHQLKKDRDLDKLVFVVTNMVESLSHAALFRRPPRLSLGAAKAEVVRAVLAYLHS